MLDETIDQPVEVKEDTQVVKDEVLGDFQEVKMVVNRPNPDELLSPSQLYKDIVVRILKNSLLNKKFTKTTIEFQNLEKSIKETNCKDCEVNRIGRPLLQSFVEEMKSCSKEEQIAIAVYLGKKVKTSIGQNWVDIITNEIIPFEYRIVKMQKKSLAPQVAQVSIQESPNKVVQEKREFKTDLHVTKSDKEQPLKEVVPSSFFETFKDLKQEHTITPVIYKKFNTDFQVPAGAKLVSFKVEPEKPKQTIKVIEPVKVRKILLKNFQGPGDIVMLTAAIRDLHICHKGKFITDVRTSSQHIWEGNPYVEWAKNTPLDEKDPEVEKYDIGYPLIHQSNQGPYHFTEAFTEELEKILGVRIDKRIGKGDIHIRPEEEVWGWTERSSWFKDYGLDGNTDYWVVDAGHKKDFTSKFWGSGKFQAVVDYFKDKIQFVQIGHEAHVHPKLNGVISLIGKTDDRQLIRLIWASSGVLTPVSFPMVLSAAIPVKPGKCFKKMNRPCVVVAGGREPSRWQADTNHQFIHTCGCLPCCDNGGCWTSRTKPIGDGDDKDKKNLCHFVTFDDNGEEVPYCMHMISPEEVIRRIEMYYKFYQDDRKRYTYNE